MSPEKRARILRLISSVENWPASAGVLAAREGAVFGFSAGAHVLRLAGISGSSTMSLDGAAASWLRTARRKLSEQVQDPINLQGSGPAPIEPREHDHD